MFSHRAKFIPLNNVVATEAGKTDFWWGASIPLGHSGLVMLLALERLADTKHACGPPSLGTGWLVPTTPQRKGGPLRKSCTKLPLSPQHRHCLTLGATTEA